MKYHTCRQRLMSIKTLFRIKSIPLKAIFTILFSYILTCQAQQPLTFKAANKSVSIVEFDEKVNRMIEEVGIPGISLAIINDNNIVYSNSYGYKKLDDENEPVDDKTVFEAASLTKIFLVYVAHKLVDQGQLDLDKPMYEYLKYPLLEHDERYKKITPRMILSHSSGIENWKRYNNRDTLEILSSPGEKFVYSGEGFHYLADVIERITGKDYEKHVKENIIDPFDLKNTFVKYDTNKLTPANYAYGHNFFDKKIKKWKNTAAVPASGNHLTAEDFAKLIVQTFNGKNLTDRRVADITSPVVKMSPESPERLYMGAGYMVNYSKEDTTVSFAGSNDGYKAWVSYSVNQKRGLVFLTNSDIGVAVLKELNELTVNLSIDPLITLLQFPQYPSNLFTFLSAYNSGGAEDLFSKVAAVHKSSAQGVDFNTLDMLSSIIFKVDGQTAKQLMDENAKLHPNNPTAYYNLGQINMAMQNYKLAYENFKKCKDLEGAYNDLDDHLMFCKEKLNN